MLKKVESLGETLVGFWKYLPLKGANQRIDISCCWSFCSSCVLPERSRLWRLIRKQPPRNSSRNHHVALCRTSRVSLLSFCVFNSKREVRRGHYLLRRTFHSIDAVRRKAGHWFWNWNIHLFLRPRRKYCWIHRPPFAPFPQRPYFLSNRYRVHQWNWFARKRSFTES